MKLNTRTFRYLSSDDWRVLTAVEIGSKNHQVVPTALIAQLSGLRTGSNGAQKCISTLAKADLVARVRNSKYDGYRLTYGGLDYLALHAHTKSSSILHLGSQMGVGKESDIYLVTSPATAPVYSPSESAQPTPTSHLTPSTNPTEPSNQDTTSRAPKPVQSILKIHRLGRTSFRSLARNRDYHRHRQHCSWQYLSRLSAQKEFAAMRALYDAGFPVPRPIACNRHTIVMSLVPGIPLKDVPLSAFPLEPAESQLPADDTAEASPVAGSANSALQQESTISPQAEDEDEGVSESHRRDKSIGALYDACMELALRLASHGLIHGDLNEFNILIENVPDPASTREADHQPTDPTQMKPHLIDFPQITSLSHPDAADYFARDIRGIRTFFEKRYHFSTEDQGPTFADAQARLEEAVRGGESTRLDVAIEAAGFSKKLTKELEAYFAQQPHHGGDDDEARENSEGEDIYGDDVEGEDLGELKEADVRENALENVSNGLDEKSKRLNVGQDEIDGSEQNNLDGSEATVYPSADQTDMSPEPKTPAAPHSKEGDVLVASKLASLSLRSQNSPRTRAKAAAGWSI